MTEYQRCKFVDQLQTLVADLFSGEESNEAITVEDIDITHASLDTFCDSWARAVKARETQEPSA